MGVDASAGLGYGVILTYDEVYEATTDEIREELATNGLLMRLDYYSSESDFFLGAVYQIGDGNLGRYIHRPVLEVEQYELIRKVFPNVDLFEFEWHLFSLWW